MQEYSRAKGRQSAIIRNVMRLLMVCGIVNAVLALIELIVFWPRGTWGITFVDILLDIGLSIVLILMGISIYKKNRWGWLGAIGLLGFLVLNQSAIATAVWSGDQHFVWFVLLTGWVIVQGILGFYLLFSKSARAEISPGYQLPPARKR